MLRLASLLLIPLTLSLACSDKSTDDDDDGGTDDTGDTGDGGSGDGGSGDGGSGDGGSGDGGSGDGGSGDGGSGDGGSGDGGSGDGGSGDGGSGDGGSGDGGSGDGGSGDGGSGDGGSGDGGFGDGGSGDGGFGDGGSGDGGSGDGGSGEDLVPTGLYLVWSDSIIESAHGDVTIDGTELGSVFGFLLTNDDWAGDYDDEETYCLMQWDSHGADLSEACDDCWKDMAWEVDTTVTPDLYGSCDTLDPDAWGEDVEDGFMGIDIVYGYGPDQESIVDTYLDDYGWADDYGLSTDTVWGAFVFSDSLGLTASALPSNQWGVAIGFAVDSGGEIVDGEWAEISGEDPPDGYYTTYGAYYFPLE